MFDMSSNSSSKYQQFRRLYIPNIFNFLLKAKIKNSKSCRNRACKSSCVGIIQCIEISMPLSWLIQTVYRTFNSSNKYFTTHLFVNLYRHKMKMFFLQNVEWLLPTGKNSNNFLARHCAINWIKFILYIIY